MHRLFGLADEHSSAQRQPVIVLPPTIYRVCEGLSFCCRRAFFETAIVYFSAVGARHDVEHVDLDGHHIGWQAVATPVDDGLRYGASFLSGSGREDDIGYGQ